MFCKVEMRGGERKSGSVLILEMELVLRRGRATQPQTRLGTNQKVGIVSLCQGGEGQDEPALRGCEEGVCHLVIDWLLANT